MMSPRLTLKRQVAHGPRRPADAPKSTGSTVPTLDDVPGLLRDLFPNLGRGGLRRCLQRHGISRLPVFVRSRDAAEIPQNHVTLKILCALSEANGFEHFSSGFCPPIRIFRPSGKGW